MNQEKLDDSQYARNCIRYINIIMRKMTAWKNKYYKEYNLNSTQASILMALLQASSVKQSQIITYLSLDKAVATKEIARLVEQGYILKKQSKEDKRSYILSLSESGHEMAIRVENVGNMYAKSLFSGMAEDDRENWLRLLEIASANASTVLEKTNEDFNNRWIYINTSHLDDAEAKELNRLLRIVAKSTELNDADYPPQAATK